MGRDAVLRLQALCQLLKRLFATRHQYQVDALCSKYFCQF